jgi:hypothetical protein
MYLIGRCDFRCGSTHVDVAMSDLSSAIHSSGGMQIVSPAWWKGRSGRDTSSCRKIGIEFDAPIAFLKMRRDLGIGQILIALSLC